MPRILRSLLTSSLPFIRPTLQTMSRTLPSLPTSLALRSPLSMLTTPSFSRLSTPLSSGQSAMLTFQPMQVRYRVMGSFYQPSQRKRKRKHGFLARLRTEGGRKMLKRRWLKGRRFVSH